MIYVGGYKERSKLLLYNEYELLPYSNSNETFNGEIVYYCLGLGKIFEVLGKEFISLEEFRLLKLNEIFEE